ncbi:MAG: pilus assembly protein TadG-related protein [Rhodobacteraceae bacterium]|nr:pilus assembly protein TadG-related protein [Paracoccaceae bacterium]
MSVFGAGRGPWSYVISGAAFRNYATRFLKDQDGSMTLVGVCAFLLMIVFGGVGIDMMYAELKRVKLQNTLDRAVLAAADLEQTLDPAGVVTDYMDKMGLGDAVTNVTVVQSHNARRVSVDSSYTTPANFLRALNVENLIAAGAATAAEERADVEISLVLDISGSMGWSGNTKMENLQDAARDFVDQMLPVEETPGVTSISLVPYNANVNVGETLIQHYNVEDFQTYSHCVTFSDADFNNPAIDPTEEQTRLGHFDRDNYSWDNAPSLDYWCSPDDYSAIMPFSTDASALKNHISGLYADGNTAIDLGMKWGVALLDPSAQPVVSALISDGDVHADVAERPVAYNDNTTAKVIVLMTDGRNTTQYDLRDSLKAGYSDVWIDDRGTSNPYDDRFSALVDGTGRANDTYFWVRYEESRWSNRYRNSRDGGSNARRMTHAEVYNRFGVPGTAYKFWWTPEDDNWISRSTYESYFHGEIATVDSDRADSRLSNICAQARAAGITIYTIAFEAPSRGETAMQDCASSPSHFFDVAGLEITDAFNAIARDITQLKLTQ